MRVRYLVAPVAVGAGMAFAAVAGGGGAVSGANTDLPSGVEAVVALPDAAPLSIGQPTAEAELEDLGTIAEQHGISLEEAIERFAWHDNFAAAAGELRKALPNAFTHAAITGHHEARVWFTADLPAGGAATLGQFSRHFPEVNVEIVEHYGLTEKEIDGAVIAAHLAVFDRADINDASTWFDHDAREITVVVPLGARTNGSSLYQDALAAAERTVGDLSSRDIAIQVIESNSKVLGGDDSSSFHYGGEALSQCTSGFTARQTSATSGTRGVITAGHCSNSLTDDGDALSLVSGTDYDGVNGDWQVHTGTETIRDDFYSGTSSSLELNLRDVSGFAVAAEGQYICRNGKMSFKDCQNVRKNSVCHDGNCYMLQMGEDMSTGGDSGGPVFYSNTVYGIHEGWMYDPSWPYDRDTVSRADTFDNATGWHLATS